MPEPEQRYHSLKSMFVSFWSSALSRFSVNDIDNRTARKKPMRPLRPQLCSILVALWSLVLCRCLRYGGTSKARYAFIASKSTPSVLFKMCLKWGKCSFRLPEWECITNRHKVSTRCAARLACQGVRSNIQDQHCTVSYYLQ